MGKVVGQLKDLKCFLSLTFKKSLSYFSSHLTYKLYSV